jgi:hypothetical protein
MSPASSVLEDKAVLQHILEYVGFGSWLLAAGVGRGWRDVYFNIKIPAGKREHRWTAARNQRYHGGDIRSTLASAVLASRSCLRWARRCGLRLHDGGINRIAGEYATKAVLKIAHQLGMQWNADVLAGAVLSYCLDKLQWVYQQQPCTISEDILVVAASVGNIPVMAWLRKISGEPYTSSTCARARRGCNAFEVLQYLRAEGCLFSVRDAEDHFKGLCGQDDMAAATWLHGLGLVDCSRIRFLDHFAAHIRDPELVQWLIESGMRTTPSGVVFAALNGRMSTVQLYLANGCPISNLSKVAAAAAESGNLELLQWFAEQGCPVDEPVTAAAAAGSGNVSMVSWLLTQGAAFESAEVVTAAATNGHLHMIKHLRALGCPWDMQAVCVKAASSGSLGILTYMREQGAQWSAADLTQLLHSAAHWNCLYIAKWLRQQGAAWPDHLGSDGCDEWGSRATAWARRLGCTAPLTRSEQRALDRDVEL